MELEIYQELLLTAAFSVLFAFLLGKITGGGFGDGQRPNDAIASSDLLDSGEKLPKSAVEELEKIIDGFRTGEGVLRSELQIVSLKGDSTVKSARCSGMEMRPNTDEVGEEREMNAKEMVIERVGAQDIEEEEVKGDGTEVELCSSEVKVVCGDGPEIGTGSGEEISVEIKEGSLLCGEDEWQGIEKSELEKLFGLAAEYSVSSSGAEALARLSRDVQMELYGFHKVATEGPCKEWQPLPLKVSAWARWHAWQKLGSMTPEIAMEQYISLLSKSIPGWICECSGEDDKLSRTDDPLGEDRLNTGHLDLNSSLQNQLSPGVERKLEGHHDLASLEVEGATRGLKFIEQGLAGKFLLNLLLPTRGALLSLCR